MLLLSVLSNAISDLLRSSVTLWDPWDGFWFGHWDGWLFESERWRAVMAGVRVTLAVLAALALIYELRARRLHQRIRESTKKMIAVVLTVLAFGAYFDFGNPNVRYNNYYHRHEFFHYYMGSKYFPEIGYNRLYERSMIAEVELGRGDEIRKKQIRDLRVNLIKPVTDSYVFSDPSQCKKHFTNQRWEAWKKDVDWFYRSSVGDYWDGMRTDHGYNPPPVWTMSGKFFASFGAASDKFFKTLSLLDVAIHIGIIVAFYWAFGWKIGAVAGVFWGCNAPANMTFTLGAFLRQDWILSLVLAICFLKKRRFFWAGVWLMWSSLLRIFPVLFFAGIGIIVLICAIQKLRKARLTGEPLRILQVLHTDHRNFIAGSLLAACVLVPASIAVCGADAYQEFFGRTIKVHNRTPLTNHMGLETMLVHTWEGRMRFMKDDNYEDNVQLFKQGRLDRFESRKPLFIAICAGIFGWMVWALRRTKLLWVGMALSAPLAMSLTNLTNYYYSMFMVCAALASVRFPIGPLLLLTSGLSYRLLNQFYWVDDQYAAQAWLFFALSMLMLYSYSRPFSLERLKAWWNFQPEPRSKPGLAVAAAQRSAPAEFAGTPEPVKAREKS